jgi:hypothetical protein
MDRITHQSPRQRGYGSTSSLRNNSLKHTRKHEKGREESNQEAKLAASGGPSGQAGRTVRDGRTNRPAGYRGLSAPLPRTVRPCATDRPKKQTEPPETTPNNGPSAGSTQTVHPVHADRPKLHPTKIQSHDGSKLKVSKNTKNTRRTGTVRTVRLVLADRPRGADRAENARP